MSSTLALGGGCRHPAQLPRVVRVNVGDDVTLLAINGDRRAFGTLMSAHKEALYRFVRGRTADPEEAYDIVQEAFVSAWGAMSRFDPERSFATWLRTIALNKCRDRTRRASVRRGLRGSCEASATERVRDPGPSPEDELIARDTLAVLARALAALPGHLRDALMLTGVDGLSQAAASAVLGCTVKSIEYRVHRAREILAHEIGLNPRS